MTLQIFKSTGQYLGYIANGFLFSRDGIYLGWVDGKHIWESGGQYGGQITEIEGHQYILRNIFVISPLARVPVLTPLALPAPKPPSNISPITPAVGWTDSF